MDEADLIMSREEIEEFLAEPITAQLATNGPTIRSVWFEWQDGAFWIISGPWAKLFTRVQRDPKVALGIDYSDFEGGRVVQVNVYGEVEIRDYDVELVRRMLRRYLGDDEESWSDAPDDYRGYLRDGGPPGAVLLRLEPRKMMGFNFSYARTRAALTNGLRPEQRAHPRTNGLRPEQRAHPRTDGLRPEQRAHPRIRGTPVYRVRPLVTLGVPGA